MDRHRGRAGFPSVRFNSGHINYDENGKLDLSICIASSRELAEYGVAKNVAVTMENHGGATEQPEACMEIFQGVKPSQLPIDPPTSQTSIWARTCTGAST